MKSIKEEYCQKCFRELRNCVCPKDKEFDLSKKINEEDFGRLDSILVKDVKEFIRLLKFEIAGNYCVRIQKELYNKIDKLAGEKLCQ